jgi:hemocyanin-like protein
MADLTDVRNRAWSLFLEPSPPRRAAFREAVPELAAAGEEPIETFSAFNRRHLERAMQLVAEMMRLANASPDEKGLQDVLDFYERMRDRENPDLVDYALMVFITHHPRGRALVHVIPSLTLRNPEFAAPSTAPLDRSVPGPELLEVLGAAEAEPGLAAVESAFVGGAQPSDGLEWYREDPFANEHHTHWHVVYPFSGIPDPADPSGPAKEQDRQGEIFFYMHQQMLARYDAERVAAGLPRLQPLADYRSAVAVGYDPGPYMRGQGFGPRPPGARMVNVQGTSVADQEGFRDRLKQAVAALSFGALNPAVAIGRVTLLGGSLESDLAGIAGQSQGADRFYGDLHNTGHVMLASASQGAPGVMTTTEVAIRDPVFYQWHKHVDDFYAAWQDRSGSRPFSDRPMVRLRKQLDPAQDRAASPDILLAFEDQLPAEAAQDLQAWARATFGDGHWDEDPGAAAGTTDTLETAMLQRRLTLADRVTTVPLEHLTHRPFVYVFRIENQVDQPVEVTVRVFLAPRSQGADRRAWIEMDKFVHKLRPLEKSVVARRGAQSSVIKKPAVMRPELLKETALEITQQRLNEMVADGLPQTIATRLQPFVGRVSSPQEVFDALGSPRWRTALPLFQRHGVILQSEQPARPDQNDTPEEVEQAEGENYCTCGWPYNLLLPRGTEEGMPFRLAVVCTDFAFDQVGSDESCGSLSFCGARDRYPDKRDMGYPFDRPFADPVRDTIMANSNMAFRDITIRRAPDVVES